MSRVQEIWNAEAQKRGRELCNGRIYCLHEYRDNCLSIASSEYRFLLAQRFEPSLRKIGLNIRPLAVTGVLICADGVVLGRRGPTVTDYAGFWEPAPAGGLSKPDPKQQILEELEEEIGITKSRVVSARACGLVEDVELGVFDIVFRLETNASKIEIENAYDASNNCEYDELAIVELSEMDDFLAARRQKLVPTLIPMLEITAVLNMP